ncbi:MAG TPA: electron transfer flavoprotein subunit alpha/FixB family protein [Streptosporangiaceae bacterium]|nr:electron transfer flavoprotein subunit alpha/FixB family protein [Streptosporangiaceae bacterium]
MNVLCLVELDEAGVTDASLRALTFARSLDAGGAQALVAVLFGPADRVPAGLLGRYGVTEAYVVEPAALDGYAPQAWARTLEGLLSLTLAGAVVAAGTDCGSEVLAHLGALTGQPMAANCLTAEPVPSSASTGGSLAVSRQRWAGLLIEDAILEGTPALLTVATDAVPPVPVDTGPVDTGRGEGGAEPTVRVHEPDLAPEDLRVRATVSAGREGGMSLATARVVVGGGRGVGGPDGFAPLEELASLLGGVVGVSRVVTSQGWRPHTQQVGQTGTKITPELYLACGISGAIQHMAGCGSARHIVVINTDPSAPILARADYAVIGDLAEVIPALVAALKERA